MKRQWLEDNPVEIIQCGEQRKRKSGKKQILSDLQGCIKRSNIDRVLENERQNGQNPTSEERMGKILQIKKIQGILHSTTRKKKIHLGNVKNNLKSIQRKKAHYTHRYKIQVTSDVSAERLEARIQWYSMFKVPNENKLSTQNSLCSKNNFEG